MSGFRPIFVATLVLAACGPPQPSVPREITELSREEKIERAVEILRPNFQPIGKCVTNPPLEEVAQEYNARVTIYRDVWEGGYPESELGSLVGFSYICSDADGRGYIADYLVNLVTGEITVFPTVGGSHDASAMRFSGPRRATRRMDREGRGQ